MDFRARFRDEEGEVLAVVIVLEAVDATLEIAAVDEA